MIVSDSISRLDNFGSIFMARTVQFTFCRMIRSAVANSATATTATCTYHWLNIFRYGASIWRHIFMSFILLNGDYTCT